MYDEGRIGNVDKIFDKMVERGFQPDGGYIKRRVYQEKRIAAFIEMGGLGRWWMMNGRGSILTVEAYHSVMEGLCEERAAEWLERAKRQLGCAPWKEYFKIVVGVLLRRDGFLMWLQFLRG